jgi:hypothetical protein
MDNDHSGNATVLIDELMDTASNFAQLKNSFINTPVLYHNLPPLNPDLTVSATGESPCQHPRSAGNPRLSQDRGQTLQQG